MIVYSLHAEVSQLTSGGRVDGRELRRCVGTSLLALSSTDSSGRLWRRLVLGLVLLYVQSQHVGGKMSDEDSEPFYLCRLSLPGLAPPPSVMSSGCPANR